MIIQSFHLKDHLPVIKSSTKTVKKDSFQELQIMQKYMVQLNKLAMLIMHHQNHHNNAKNLLKNVKNSKLLTTVFLLIKKILNNKFSIMDPLLLLFQSIEISQFTKMDYIKYILKIKSSVQDMPLKLLVGMFKMERIVGWLKIVGEKTGETMVLRNYLFNSRCILVNQ